MGKFYLKTKEFELSAEGAGLLILLIIIFKYL